MDYQQLCKYLSSRAVLLLFCLAMLFLICGCGTGSERHNEVKNTIKLNIGPPKPYKLAIEELEAHNLDKGLRYLDLVIKDFPDNQEYVYRAYFLKTIIYTDYFTANLAVTDALLEGLRDNFFLESNEKRQILDSIQIILVEVDTYKKPFLESTLYVYKHYEKYKDLDFSLHYPRSEDNTEAINAVEWFRKSGTPMPSDDQINSALRDARVYFLEVSLDGLIKKNNVNYPAYFYATGAVAMEWDEDLAKKLTQEIIDITNNDKYNKYRLDAEDVLKNNF